MRVFVLIVEPVELDPLLDGAFQGMTEAMDPFSEYVPPQRQQAFLAASFAIEGVNRAAFALAHERVENEPVYYLVRLCAYALIIVAIFIATLLWADLRNKYVWVVLVVMVGFGLIGWWDDWIKIVKRDPNGMKSRTKYALQSLLGLAVGLFLYTTANVDAATTLYIPFFKNVALPLAGVGGAVFFVGIAYFWIVGFSNAVNLTDGLDGLAIMPTVLVACALGVFAYASGNAVFSGYLGIPKVPGAGELVVFCAAIAGAGLGFLWFNTYPAMVFMGDIGALALGAVLGTIAVIVRQELVLVIMGGIFVIETLSVMIQVASFKLTGKRVFRMAPIHHHFELKGWPEPRVIVRFWIISVVLVLVGLATLKIR